MLPPAGAAVVFVWSCFLFVVFLLLVVVVVVVDDVTMLIASTFSSALRLLVRVFILCVVLWGGVGWGGGIVWVSAVYLLAVCGIVFVSYLLM